MAIKQKIKVTSVNKPDLDLAASFAQVISSSQNILRKHKQTTTPVIPSIPGAASALNIAKTLSPILRQAREQRILGLLPSPSTLMMLAAKTRLTHDICDGLENENNAAINLLIKDKAFDAHVLANVISLMGLDRDDRAQKIEDELDELREFKETFSGGRKPGAISPLKRYVESVVNGRLKESNKVLWVALCKAVADNPDGAIPLSYECADKTLFEIATNKEYVFVRFSKHMSELRNPKTTPQKK